MSAWFSAAKQLICDQQLSQKRSHWENGYGLAQMDSQKNEIDLKMSNMKNRV